jgi:hypothetical protein
MGRYRAKSHTDKTLHSILGKRIVGVRHMTEDEVELFGWDCQPYRTTLIQLEDDSLIIVMSDPEGNDTGALHVQEGTE